MLFRSLPQLLHTQVSCFLTFASHCFRPPLRTHLPATALAYAGFLLSSLRQPLFPHASADTSACHSSCIRMSRCIHAQKVSYYGKIKKSSHNKKTTQMFSRHPGCVAAFLRRCFFASVSLQVFPRRRALLPPTSFLLCHLRRINQNEALLLPLPIKNQ